MTKKTDAAKTAPINSLPAGSGIPAMWTAKLYAEEVGILLTDMGNVQGRITDLAIQSLLHLEAHKDVNTLNRFIVGMPKGFRRNALISWTLAYGCVKVNQDKGTAKLSPLQYDKMKVVKVELAMADPWHGHLPEKDPITVFDLQRAIHMVLQKAKGMTVMVNGKPLDPEVANDMLKAMAAMVGESFTAEPSAVAVPVPEAPAPQNRREGDTVPEVVVVAKAVKPKAKKEDALL